MRSAFYVGVYHPNGASQIAKTSALEGAQFEKLLTREEVTIYAECGHQRLSVWEWGGRSSIFCDGVLFDRRSGKRITGGENELSQDPRALRGGQAFSRWLAEECWGQYQGLICNPTGTFLFSDPVGTKRTYYVWSNGSCVFSSSFQLLTRLANVTFRLNRRYLEEYLSFGAFSSEHCGIQPVRELLAGHCLDFSTGNQSEYYNPISLLESFDYPSASLEDFDAEFNLVSDSIFRSLTLEYKNPLLTLSGGIDSSYVALQLSRSGTSASCWNIGVAVEGVNHDECELAELVASALDLKYLSTEARLDDHARTSVRDEPMYAKPSEFLPEIEAYTSVVPFLEGEGCDSIWFGDGGDEVFWDMEAPLVYYDLNKEVPGRKLGNLFDACSSTTTTVLDVIKCRSEGMVGGRLLDAIRSGRLQLARDQSISKLLANDHKTSIMQFIPSWVDQLARFGPSKVLQVYGLFTASHVWSQRKVFPYLDPVYPLMALPLLELCLRFPMRAHVRNGQSRCLPRYAMNDHLPRSVTHSRRKTGGNNMFLSTPNANKLAIERKLTSGILVQMGLVNQRSLKKLFEEENVYQNDPFANVLSRLLAAENWLRSSAVR